MYVRVSYVLGSNPTVRLLQPDRPLRRRGGRANHDLSLLGDPMRKHQRLHGSLDLAALQLVHHGHRGQHPAPQRRPIRGHRAPSQVPYICIDSSDARLHETN